MLSNMLEYAPLKPVDATDTNRDFTNALDTITEDFGTPEHFFANIPEVTKGVGGKVEFILDGKSKVFDGLHISTLLHNDKLLLLVANQCPVIKSWLLHILVQNENASGFYNGVFVEATHMSDDLSSISFSESEIDKLFELNIGNTAGNSFLTIGANSTAN